MKKEEVILYLVPYFPIFYETNCTTFLILSQHYNDKILML